MRCENSPVYLMFFCYGVLSFATYFPKGQTDLWQWLIFLMANFLLYGVYFALVPGSGHLGKLHAMLLNFYIIRIIARKIYRMYFYMQTYHGQSALPATAAISAAVIITGLNMFRQENRRLAKIMFLFTALLLALAFFLNREKADGINVYNIVRYTGRSVYLNVFDFAVPMLISAEYTGKGEKAENLAFAAAVFGFFAVVSVFAFCCVGGNILYSLSPLQMLFQLSATSLIKNYDAIYNLFLFFAFFAALTALVNGLKKVKEDFTHFGNNDLLAVIPLVFAVPYLPDIFWPAAEAVCVLLLVAGRRYEKS